MTALTMKLLSAADASTSDAAAHTLVVANTEDPRSLALEGVARIDLHFPKFTDGRAYTQAFYLQNEKDIANTQMQLDALALDNSKEAFKHCAQ